MIKMSVRTGCAGHGNNKHQSFTVVKSEEHLPNFSAYSASMDGQAKKMGVQVNGLLGQGLCADFETGEIEVGSVYLTAVFDDNKVSTIIIH